MNVYVRLPLTKQQRRVFDFIISYMGFRGYPPTLHEIQEEIGIRNSGMVFKILKALEKKGYIIRERYQQRGIRIRQGVETREQMEIGF